MFNEQVQLTGQRLGGALLVATGSLHFVASAALRGDAPAVDAAPVVELPGRVTTLTAVTTGFSAATGALLILAGLLVLVAARRGPDRLLSTAAGLGAAALAWICATWLFALPAVALSLCAAPLLLAGLPPRRAGRTARA